MPTTECDCLHSPLVPKTRSVELLQLTGTLGAGGMGVVHEALQRSVDRRVALKTLLQEDTSEHHVEQLVREAWVMALLEHPNIAPIYTLTTHEGRPAIVCKRIFGKEWSTYLRSPELVSEKFEVEDVLEWHLGVLLKVIDAIRFAHSRGILHRDLKPSNVMIGEFGEVYVMDWGLAVSTRPDHRGKLQLACDVFKRSGTYCYLAPEMLEPQRQRISERTDVYQLGGILYEICMGEPPHAGEDWEDMERSIRQSRPAFTNGLPMELVSVCQRALRALPKNRFGSANAFRLALLDYLRHRGAAQVRRKGEHLLFDLEELLEQSNPPERRAVYQLFEPCRFAFQQALEVWPEDEEAEILRSESVVLVSEFELEMGEPAHALTLLEAEEGADAAGVRQRCEVALSRKEATEVADAQLRRRSNREVDAASRRLAIGGIAAGWSLLPVFLKLLVPMTYSNQIIIQLVFLSLWLLVGRLGDRWVRSSDINYRSYMMVLAATLLALIVKWGSLTMEVPAETAQVYDLFVFFTAGLLTVFLIDLRMWPPALAYLAAFAIAAWMPSLCLWAMAASNGVLALSAAWVWRPQPHTMQRI